jgi:hypothetical protein
MRSAGIKLVALIISCCEKCAVQKKNWKTLFKVRSPLLIIPTGNESLLYTSLNLNEINTGSFKRLYCLVAVYGAHLHQVDYGGRASSIILSLFNPIHHAWCVDIKGNMKNTNTIRSSSNTSQRLLYSCTNKHIYSIREIKHLQLMNLTQKGERNTY